MKLELGDRIRYATPYGAIWGGVVSRVWAEGNAAQIQWDWDNAPSSWVDCKQLTAETDSIQPNK